MANYIVNVELDGDSGSVECCIDELIQSVSFMDLDRAVIQIHNLGECCDE